MKVPLLLFTVAAGFMLQACGGQREEKTQETAPAKSPYTQEQLLLQDSLWTGIMAVHDSVMPKTSDINRMSQRFKKELKENPKLDVATKSQLITVLEFLEQSDASMFDWMNNLKQINNLRKAEMPHEEIVSYLLQEKTAIVKVSDAMLTSLDAGRKLMEQHKMKIC
jgi:succinate dehydrogenase flavin-adding protein (antitoxin of CptAB toxin-antitoxin module)